LVVDEVDAELLAVLRCAVPASTGNTRRLATLGPPLHGLDARIVDENNNCYPRAVGLIELRGGPVMHGYLGSAGFIDTQDDHS